MAAVITFFMTSGVRIEVTHILLYEETAIRSAQAHRAQAAGSLKDSSVGLGTIGSPGWVLASGVALGVLSTLASNAAAKTAAEHFRQSEALESSARDQARFLAISELSGLESPDVGIWKGAAPSPKGRTEWTFVHDGGPALKVRTSDMQELWVFLNKVEMIHVPTSPVGVASLNRSY